MKRTQSKAVSVEERNRRRGRAVREASVLGKMKAGYSYHIRVPEMTEATMVRIRRLAQELAQS